ncbi:MAG: DUF2341 domain-containing protein, partial [Verrucomicrobiota bacterium]
GTMNDVALTNLFHPVTGLLPDTDYYYAFRATNCAETLWTIPARPFRTTVTNQPFNQSMKITFCGYERGSALHDFPALIVLNPGLPGFDYATFADPNGWDLRFFNSNRTVELNYDIDTWNPLGDSFIWVQVPELKNPDTCIWALWGNPNAGQAPYTQNGATWSAGYTGVWHLADDGGLGIFPDSVAFNDAGDNVGSDTTTTPGPIGEAQFFDGGSDKLLVANESNFDFYHFMSVSLWFRVNAFDTDWQTLIAKGTVNSWELHREFNTDNLRWFANGVLTAPVNVNDGQWHHLLANKSSVTGTELYIDGTLAAADTANLNLNALNDNDVFIGDNPAAPG